MLIRLISCGICLLLSMDSVFGSTFCEDSTIDSITYANDLQMYFITSGGKFWWIKETNFPPKETDGQPLPSPFTKSTAAVYIDSDNGCRQRVQTRVKGIRSKQKEIWITEIINGRQKLISYDTKYGKWSEVMNYDEDRCISKARVDFTDEIDAMFARNYLDVYLIQKNRYAMVDCSFICTDPENKFGDDRPDHSIEDFGTKDIIHGMFVRGDKNSEKLFMFQKSLFYILDINAKDSVKGRVVARKSGSGKSVLNEFLKIKVEDQSDCTDSQPKAEEPAIDVTQNENIISEADPDQEPQTNGEENSDNEQKNEEENTSESSSSSDGSGIWIIVIIIVVVLLILTICIGLLFAFRSKKTEDKEALKPKASGIESKPSKGVESKVGSQTGIDEKPSKVGSQTGSKMGTNEKQSNVGSKVGSQTGTKEKKSTVASNVGSTVGSTMSTRSNIERSALPNSKTSSAVKSSSSKK